MCFVPKQPGQPASPAVPDAPSATADPISTPTEAQDDPRSVRRRAGKRGLRLSRGSGLNV